MGPRKWMERGYKVLIRCSVAYLWKRGETTAKATPVANGRWMDHNDLDAEPWVTIDLTPEQLDNFERAAADCYCYQGVDRCDFCNSTRTPDRAASSNGPAFYNVCRRLERALRVARV